MIVAIRGPHNSGKTTFIEHVLDRLKDHRVIVIKNSQHDMIDHPGTDTFRYRQKGAMASIIRTKKETIFFFHETDLGGAIHLAKKFNPDIIFLEGYRSVRDVDCLILDLENTPDNDALTQKILGEKKEKKIEIYSGGNLLPLNQFVSDLFSTTIKSMVSSLRGAETNDIEISIKN